MQHKNEQLELSVIDIFRSIFIPSLPTRPYCTNSFEIEGLYRKARLSAISRRLIQPNAAAMLKWLVFDVDRHGAALAWEEGNLPAPNLVVINPENSHAHIIYALEVPVCRTEHAHLKPLQYVASIEFQMKLMLGADLSYAGLICKNPLHDHWRTWFIHNKQYSLDELAEYITTLPSKLPKKAQQTGLGRNCSLFDKARKRAYAAIRQYQTVGGYQAFFNAVLANCELLNGEFSPPLPESEVKAIAKSIAKWTWNRFDVDASDKRFSEKQTARGERKGKSKREIGLHLLLKGESIESVAESVGVSVSTVYRWCERVQHDYQK